ncbi:MAG: hypothetical protein AAF944_20410 [Bacteroidota bacterium]
MRLNAICLSIVLIVGFLLACQPRDRREHYGRLVGEWEIVDIKSLGEKMALEEVVRSRQLAFTGQGQFWHGKHQEGFKGRWKIIGDQIQLLQLEIKDLNGRIVSSETRQLWDITLSDEWMIWRGTAQNDTQHLKILFKKMKQ